MDEKVFQEEWNRIKYIGKVTIHHCQKMYEKIFKEHQEFCADRKWLQRCSPTQFLDENYWFKISKESQSFFRSEAISLCCHLLDDEIDPRVDLVDDYLTEVVLSCRQDVETMQNKLYRFYNKHYPEAEEEKNKLWQCWLEYRRANGVNDEVPKHSDEPVDVECTVDDVDNKLMVEAADVELEQVKPQVILPDGLDERLDSVDQSLEPVPDSAHDYDAEKEVSISQVAEEISDDLLCHGKATEPPDDDVVDIALFKFTQQASSMCPPHRKIDPKEGHVKYLGLVKKNPV